jgi:hypothetical protein
MSGICVNPSGVYLPWWQMGGNEHGKKIPPTGRMGKVVRHDSPADNSGSSAKSFDLWLNKRLRMLYGPVLNEAIPEDLVELIETHRKSDNKSKS